MKSYEKLYELAKSINTKWSDRKTPDWADAEQLVRELKDDPNSESFEGFSNIIAYADSHADWDSGVVAEWPNIIIDELETSDKVYDYREGDNDDWYVFGTFLSGDEDWVGNVVTESVAITLVNALNNPASQ